MHAVHLGWAAAVHVLSQRSGCLAGPCAAFAVHVGVCTFGRVGVRGPVTCLPHVCHGYQCPCVHGCRRLGLGSA